MSLQGAAGTEELIFYVNGRKVSVAREECGERGAAVPEVTATGVWFPFFLMGV